MSEISPPVESSAPVSSTRDTAEAVIDAFDSTETTGTAVSGDTPAPAESAAPSVGAPTAAEPPPPLSEIEQLLHAEGITAQHQADGREHRIPYSKVKRIIENGLKKGRTEWDQTRITLERERDQVQSYLQQLRAGVAGDPEAFLRDLAGVDTRYQRFLEVQRAEAQAAANGNGAEAGMPPPDLPLADGSATYSLDGIRKLLEWNTERTIRQADQRIEARLKPLTERESQLQARQQQDAVARQAHDKAQSQMTTAQTWPLFGPLAADGTLSPFQQEVLAALKADPALDLRGAYMQVALPRLTEDDNKKRERLLKEINGAPKSTSTPRQGAESVRSAGGATTAEIAARTLARLEKNGG